MPVFKQKKTPEIPPLLRPPLVEAIVEIRWELKRDQQTQRLRDVAYPMMYGRLYERLKKDFPLIEDLPATQAHPEAAPYVVRHRLRKDKESWPALQIGPGIITINETKNYSWTELRALTLRLVEAIVELFPRQEMPLNFVKTEVRYINAIRLDSPDEHPLAFFQEKLHTKLELDAALFDGSGIGQKPLDVGVNLVYPLSRPIGNLLIALNLGEVDAKPAVLFQTIVQSFGETAPQDTEGFTNWLLEAHEISEHSFHTFCKGPLMNRFCGVQ